MYKFNLKYFKVSFIFLSFLLGGCGGGGGDSGTTSKQKVSAVVEHCPRVLPPGISENLQFHVSGNYGSPIFPQIMYSLFLKRTLY